MAINRTSCCTSLKAGRSSRAASSFTSHPRRRLPNLRRLVVERLSQRRRRAHPAKQLDGARADRLERVEQRAAGDPRRVAEAAEPLERLETHAGRLVGARGVAERRGGAELAEEDDGAEAKIRRAVAQCGGEEVGALEAAEALDGDGADGGRGVEQRVLVEGLGGAEGSELRRRRAAAGVAVGHRRPRERVGGLQLAESVDRAEADGKIRAQRDAAQGVERRRATAFEQPGGGDAELSVVVDQ